MGAACSRTTIRQPKRNSRNSGLEEVSETFVTETKTDLKRTRSRGLRKVNQYKHLSMVGRGSFGAVYRAVDAENRAVAVKILDKGTLTKKTGRRFGPPRASRKTDTDPVDAAIMREIAVMKLLNHPNCVRLFEVMNDPEGDRMFLVMELLVGGEVMSPANLPAGSTHHSEDAARYIFRDLLDGLEYLHANMILHRDIKPENLVFVERPAYRQRAESTVLEDIGAGVTGAIGGLKKLPESLGGLGNMIANSPLTRGRTQELGFAPAAARAKSRRAADRLPRPPPSPPPATPPPSPPAAAAPLVREGTLARMVLPTEPERDLSGELTGSSGGLAAPPPPELSLASSEDSAHSHPKAAARATLPDTAPGRAASRRDRGTDTESGRQTSRDRRLSPAGLFGRLRNTVTESERGSAVEGRPVPRCKILDFGVSQICLSDDPHSKKGSGGFDDTVRKALGTPSFYAPEMCRKGAFHGRPADVWTCGVTLAMLVSGEECMPFAADNMPEVFDKIRLSPPAIPEHVSPALRALILAILTKDPRQRPSIRELRQHPWVTSYGAEPMPEQANLQVVVSEEDLVTAVRSTPFAIIKAKSQFRLMLRRAKARKEAEKEAAAAAERAAAAGTAQASPSPVPSAPSPVPSAAPSEGRRRWRLLRAVLKMRKKATMATTHVEPAVVPGVEAAAAEAAAEAATEAVAEAAAEAAAEVATAVEEVAAKEAAPAADRAVPAEPSKPDVNTATVEELGALSGLGLAAAAGIVEYRVTHGLYADLDAVAAVPGIRKKQLLVLRDTCVAGDRV